MAFLEYFNKMSDKEVTLFVGVVLFVTIVLSFLSTHSAMFTHFFNSNDKSK